MGGISKTLPTDYLTISTTANDNKFSSIICSDPFRLATPHASSPHLRWSSTRGSDSSALGLRKATAPASCLSPLKQDRAATCQLRPPRHSRLSRGAHASAPLHSLSMGMRRSTRACEARVPCRAGCNRVMTDKIPLRRRGFSPSAHGPGATWQLRPPRHSRLSRGEHAAQHFVRCLSGGGAARTRATRARHAALVAVGPYLLQGHCTGEMSLSIAATPCCDVPAAPSRHSRLLRGVHASAPLRSLSLGTRRSTRTCNACAPCCAGCSRCTRDASPLHRREASFHRRKTVLQRASCGL